MNCICDIIHLISTVKNCDCKKMKEVEKYMRNEVYDEIKIDTSLIPDYLVESLAAATLQFVKELKQNPVTNKMLEEKKKELGLQ